MRFYLDENLSPRIAAIARGLGLDVISAHELGHRATEDDVLLRYAAADTRCLVTQNYRDFARLTVEFRRRREKHTGVVFVPKRLADGPAADLARALERFAFSHPGGLFAYQIGWLTSISEAS